MTARLAACKELSLQESVLTRIAQGDPSAVEDCIERYGGLVWSLARRLSTSRADAEDGVQEVFVEIWKNADRYRGEIGSEATFIAMIARRRLIDRLRKNRRTLEQEPVAEQDLSSSAPDPAAKLELAEEGSRAAECLERLRSVERQVLEMSIIEGLSQSLVAEAIGIPLGTVKTHARRGLIQMRDCMQIERSQGVVAQ
jgi:RNA polymerase sigma-70 factor (ECF subfamily)